MVSVNKSNVSRQHQCDMSPKSPKSPQSPMSHSAGHEIRVRAHSCKCWLFEGLRYMSVFRLETPIPVCHWNIGLIWLTVAQRPIMSEPHMRLFMLKASYVGFDAILSGRLCFRDIDQRVNELTVRIRHTLFCIHKVCCCLTHWGRETQMRVANNMSSWV